MSTWGWVCMGALVGVVICVVAANQALRSSELAAIESVQSGVRVLMCDMPDGARAIDPALVVDLVDGKWLFTNGYAGGCVLK